MYKDDLLIVICLVYGYSIWIFNDAYIEMGEFWTFLLCHREVLVDTRKEVLEELGDLVVTQKIICVASNN